MPRGRRSNKTTEKEKKEHESKQEQVSTQTEDQMKTETQMSETPTTEAIEEEKEPEQAQTPAKSTSFGRSASLHSLHLQEMMSTSKGSEIAPISLSERKPGDFLAVPATTNEKFWLCQIREARARRYSIPIVWLEVKQGNTYRIDDASIDTIVPGDVLMQVPLQKLEDGSYLLSEETKIEILKRLEERQKTSTALQEEMEEESDREESEEMFEEAPKSKQKRRTLKSPRKRTPKKSTSRKTKEEVGESDQKEEEDENKQPTRRKKRKAEEVEEEPPAKKPRTQQRRTADRKKTGVANPDIEIIHEDPTFRSSDNQIRRNCCTYCTSKEMIRAVEIKNMDLLKQLIDDRKHVFSLFVTRSADVHETALHVAIRNNDIETIQLIAQEENSKKRKERVEAPTVSLKTMDTGYYNRYTYGHYVRPLKIARGGKEGNNAFAADLDHSHHYGALLDLVSLTHFALSYPNLTKETAQTLILSFPEIESVMADTVFEAVRCGNREVAGFIVDNLVKRGGYGFNFLHKQALLNNGEDFEKFKPISVRKKPLANHGITPIHCAAINPNSKYLKALLDTVPDYNILDFDRRRPIHYAAACVSAEPLHFLLSRGVDFREGDEKGITPLMIAARYGRLHNVVTLVKIAEEKQGEGDDNFEDQKGKGEEDNAMKEEEDEGEEDGDSGVKKKRSNRQKEPTDVIGKLSLQILYQTDRTNGYTPLHIAALNGHADILKLLIDKANSSDYVNKMDKQKRTALTLAAMRGHLECVKLLVEKGAFIDHPDKLKRTPLIHAVKNGQLVVVSYLAHMGADVNARDSSKNSVVHYAAGYGWLECLKFLVRNSADPNTMNDWKTTPLGIAMMKGHLACADFLLEQEGVDVNIKNDQGQTLLAQMIDGLVDSSYKQIEYLLTKKQIDVNLSDIYGMTPLHVLASQSCEAEKTLDQSTSNRRYFTSDQREKLEKQLEQFNNLCLKTAELLLKHAAKVNVRDIEGVSPLMLAVQNKRFNLIKLFIDHGADITGTNKQGFANLANEIDHEGYTPLLRAFQMYHDYVPSTKSSSDQSQQFYLSPFGISSTAQSDTKSSPNASEEPLDDEQKAVFRRFMEFVKLFVNSTKVNLSAAVEKLKKKRKDKTKVKESQQKQRDVKLSEEAKLALEKKKYGPHGQYTALHFIVLKQRTEDLAEFLKFQPLDLNKVDLDGRTPLHIAISLKSELAFLLLDAGADVNIVTVSGDTPLTIAIKKGDQKLVERLLQLGARIDYVDKKHNLTPLHVAALHRQTEIVKILLAKGASVNALDKNLRTPLHFAVNVNSKSTDLNFDLEYALITAGADVNAQDKLGCTPMHYAFIDMSNFASTSPIDPIETITGLSSIKNIQIDVPNVFKKTPLHYAAQRSSTISSLYLIERKAQLEREDEDGNTPLGIALLSGHLDFAIMLIQAGSSVKHPVFIVKRVPKKKEKTDKTPEYEDHDEEMKDLESSSSEDEDSDEDDSSNYLWRYTYVPVYRPRTAKPKSPLKESKESSTLKTIHHLPDVDDREIESKKMKTMFDRALEANHQGLMYLMLDKGFDYLQAMQDAVQAGRLQLVVTLLNKTHDDRIVQVTNSDKRNLLHVLALASPSVGKEMSSTTVAEKLIARGVDFKGRDRFGCTPLHYAAKNKNMELCKFFINHQVDVNQTDSVHEMTALGYALQNDKFNNSIFDLVKLLLQNQANPNIRYEDKTLYEKEGKITPLIHAVRSSSKPFVELLLQYKADVNFPDSKGRTPLMHAIRVNDEEMVKLLLDTKQVKINAVDENGWSAVHHVINPTNFGSYENEAILKILHENGADIDLKDSNGRSPLYYASLQDSKTLFNALMNLGAKSLPKTPLREQSAILDWADTGINYELDAEEFIKTKERIVKEDTPIKVDRVFGTKEERQAYEVYAPSPDNVYDTLLTKVDVKYGAYGWNNFYKMQILHDKVKDLYILWTRWGRIGTIGQYQRTPFYNAKEATLEFEKIFRSKTGNHWAQRDKFEKKPKKYNLIKLKQSRVKPEDLLKPFNFDKAPQSNLPEELKKAMKVITNLAIYKKTMKEGGIDTELMPLSKLTKETLFKAQTVLGDIKELLDKLTVLQREQIHSIDEIQATYEKIAELSNVFYELIPHANFSHDRILPINDNRALQLKMTMINNLIDLEVASKILLGALASQEKINPLDYSYKALNVTMEALDKNSEEYKTLFQYATKSKNNGVTIGTIFRVQRKGEAERIAKWKSLDNHYLLWHGSDVSNYMGILSTGLRIAPPEAETTGASFGRGIYFADVFDKSVSYVGYDDDGIGFILLCEVALGKMYEVTTPNTELERAPDGYHSVKALGWIAPNFNNSIVLPNGVRIPIGPLEDKRKQQKVSTSSATATATKAVILGDEEESELDETSDVESDEQKNIILEYNEYIVYDPSQVRIRYLVQLKL